MEMMSEISPVLLEDSQSPGGEIKNDDRLVGTLSDELKRLYIAMRLIIGKKEAVIEHLQREHDRFAEDEADIPANKSKQMRQDETYARLEENLIIQIFSISVRREFPDVGTDQIDIRKGWQIVLTNPANKKDKGANPPPLSRVMEHMFP